MEWCCMGFQWHYESAGRRGFAVVVEASDAGKPKFVLQHRVVAKGAPAPADLPGSPLSATAIRHCPWCGVSLDERYGVGFEDLVRPGLGDE